MSTELITDDGVLIEQISGVPAPMVDNAMMGALVSVEIDRQIATAKQYPRSIKAAINNILSLATLDEETATECIYELKRSGKKLRGPSIRLAEIIASQWGNCRDSACVVSIDRVNKIITAEGTFHDLESNRGTRASVQRRISGKDGHLFSDDMITVTGNAACSIARRNAILAGVPKGVWRKAVEAAEEIIKGDGRTLERRRESAVAALQEFKITPEQIYKVLGVKGLEDVDLDHLVTLRVYYSGLKNGETSVDEILRQIEPERAARITAATAELRPASVVANGVAAFAEPAKEPAAPVQQTALFDADEDAGDLDIVANDIMADLSNAKSGADVDRIMLDAHSELDRMPPKLRNKVETHYQAVAASKKKARKG